MACKNISTRDKAILQRVFNPNLPYGDVTVDGDEESNQEVEVLTEAVKQAKDYETAGVKAAEAGNVMESLDFFNKAISAAPERASGYNNRAQSLRLNGDVQGALDDLNKALELSGGHGNAACQSFTQRGLIRRLEGDEEGALEDFKAGARLGSPFAKQMVISLNPYAALCNQMLNEVFQKVRAGEM